MSVLLGYFKVETFFISNYWYFQIEIGDISFFIVAIWYRSICLLQLAEAHSKLNRNYIDETKIVFLAIPDLISFEL